MGGVKGITEGRRGERERGGERGGKEGERASRKGREGEKVGVGYLHGSNGLD